jgi:hypothetical protein
MSVVQLAAATSAHRSAGLPAPGAQSVARPARVMQLTAYYFMTAAPRLRADKTWPRARVLSNSSRRHSGHRTGRAGALPRSASCDATATPHARTAPLDPPPRRVFFLVKYMYSYEYEFYMNFKNM